MDARLRLRRAGAQLWAARGGLLALVTMAGLLYWIISAIFSLEKEIAAVILAGMLTVFGSVLSLIFSRQYEKKREVEREIRNQKIPIYESFIKFLFHKVWFRLKEDGDVDGGDPELVEFMQEFSVSVLIWGSDDVLREWIKFVASMRSFGTEQKDSTDVLVNAIVPTGQLLISLRKDIGHDNKNLTGLGLMHLFVTDLKDEIDKAIASGSATTDQ
jgi:hypothetical protein